MFYTGIGSRETPKEILQVMKAIAYVLYFQGWTLRSGGAPGADFAFEDGHRLAKWVDYQYYHEMQKLPINLEIYLPWKTFLKDRKVENDLGDWKSGFFWDFPKDIEEKASAIVDEIHPAPHNLSYGARKLHMRNCYQVLGQDLNTPSSFVVCWTKNAQEIGGTRTAIVLAKKHGIPVCNLAIKENELMVRALGRDENYFKSQC